MSQAKPDEKTVFKDFVCGGTAAMINICVLFPFYKTIFFQQLDNLTLSQATVRLYQEGAKNLYRGLLPPLIQNAVNRSIMFGVYSRSLVVIHEKDLVKNKKVKISLASTTAGLMEAVVMPFERVQVLLQNKMYHDKFRHTYHTFSSLLKEHNVKELYRGFYSVLLRNCLGNTLYFMACDKFITPSIMTTSTPMTEIKFSLSILPSPLYNFVVGGILGATIGLTIYPLNVVKTRQQTYVGGPFYSAFNQITVLYKERGSSLRHLYRGAPANCVRSVASWGLLTMLNEWLKSSTLLSRIFNA